MIRVGIIGLGNCASSLVQGVSYYANTNEIDGLMRKTIGGYAASDLHFVWACDVDERKVGKPLEEAIFSEPNCTKVFFKDLKNPTIVKRGKTLDGISKVMDNYPDSNRFIESKMPEPRFDDLVKSVKDAKVDVLINYLPVGSVKATEYYAELALASGTSFVNAIPVFLGSDPSKNWGERFKSNELCLIGDDIKAQVGATITHRALANMFKERGVKLSSTYQINTGGNTDFLNMLERSRLEHKKISKTEAVTSVSNNIEQSNVHIGPSDYIPWLKDNKVAFIRLEGKQFGGVEMNMEVRLSVEDSPNSAGIALDMIRCAKAAHDKGIYGYLMEPSTVYCKHPLVQSSDAESLIALESFLGA